MWTADDSSAPHVQPSIDRSAIPSRISAEAFEDAGECLLYNPIRDEASALNRTATEIWQLCDGVQSIGAIAALLASRYGVDAESMLDDVVCGLSALHARGLIEFPRGGIAAATP